MGAFTEGNSTGAKVLMIPVTSCLTKEAKATDPTRAMDLAKIQDLIGNASRSHRKEPQQPGEQLPVGSGLWGRTPHGEKR